MQIKHGACCLSVCWRLCALINLCNFNRHKWGCYHFCVTGWALEHWLIGYGWIIHLNHRIAAWLCGPCQWLSPGWRAELWEWYDNGRLKMIHALSANFSSSAEKLHLFFFSFLFFTSTMNRGPDPAFLLFFFPSPTILHNKTFSTCSDICWWIDLYCCSNIVVCHDDACFGGIDHLKLLWLRQFMPTAWQQHISKGLLCTRKVPDKVKLSLSLRWNCDCAGFFSYIPTLTASMLIRSLEIKRQTHLFCHNNHSYSTLFVALS